jgi:hypothetical protein
VIYFAGVAKKTYIKDSERALKTLKRDYNKVTALHRSTANTEDDIMSLTKYSTCTFDMCTTPIIEAVHLGSHHGHIDDKIKVGTP